MISFREGVEATYLGGQDIVISLTEEDWKVLGHVGDMVDHLDTALWALIMLRTGRNPHSPTGEVQNSDWYTVINDLDHRLIPRLEGIRDAAVRAHHAAGGSLGQLANAMDAGKSTAQYRRDAVLGRTPTLFEKWATTGGPEINQAVCPCGCRRSIHNPDDSCPNCPQCGPEDAGEQE